MFSLSPSVDIRENDYSLRINNLPTSKTGLVLRSEKGPANKIISIKNENDLIRNFGLPNSENYQDWYNAWNFLQYASSLYVVRPLSKNKKNIRIDLKEDDFSKNTIENFYNEDIADLNNVSVIGDYNLTFIYRYIENVIDKGLCVCDDLIKFNEKFTDLKVFICLEDVSKNPNSQEIEVIDIFDNIKNGDYFEFKEGVMKVLNIVENINNTKTITFDKVVKNFLKFEFVKDADFEVIKETIFSKQIYISSIDENKIITSTNISDIKKGDYIIDNSNNKFFIHSINENEITFFNIDNQTFNLTEGNNINILGIRYNIPTFRSFFDFPPDFSKNEFGVLIFEKDFKDNVWKINKSKDMVIICSYNENAKDYSGKSLDAEKVFLSNPYFYCKIHDRNKKIGSSGFIKLYNEFEDTKCSISEISIADIKNAFDLFSNPEEFDINILIAHELDLNYASEIAYTRKDCIAIVCPYDYTKYVSVGKTKAVENLIEEFGSQTESINKKFFQFNDYTSIYGDMKYQYDRFNDINRWVCIAGDIAGLIAQVDAYNEPWVAPAGLNRGKLKNLIKLAINPNKSQRDDLYFNSINPIISIPGEGIGVVFGQKTAVKKPSAFDRLNVRRLMIVIEKAIASASRYVLFEFNDDFTRTRLKSMIEPYLREVKAKRGLYDFRVICDRTNNTDEIIDNNVIVLDVYLKPNKVGENILINMNITKTGVSFDEVISNL